MNGCFVHRVLLVVQNVFAQSHVEWACDTSWSRASIPGDILDRQSFDNVLLVTFADPLLLRVDRRVEGRRLVCDRQLRDLWHRVNCVVSIFRAPLPSALELTLLKKRLHSDLLARTRLIVSFTDHVFD